MTVADIVKPTDELLDQIGDLQTQINQLTAKQTELIAQYTRWADTQADATLIPTMREVERDWYVIELAERLTVSYGTARITMSQAATLHGEYLPRTRERMSSGELDAYKASMIAAGRNRLSSNLDVIHFDDASSAFAATHTPAQLRSWIKHFLAKYVPAPETAKAEHDQRRVMVTHHEHGMSWLAAYLPSDAAERLERVLNREAKKIADDRTFDQKRADALLDILQGTMTKAGGSVAIGVTVPWSVLAGDSDESGVSFDGSAVYPAERLRQLAEEPGTLFYSIVTDDSDDILSIHYLGRSAPDHLRVAVAIRDGTCAGPMCTVPALDSDLDHEIPYPEGPTRGDNFTPGCRVDHNQKTHGKRDSIG